MHIRELNNKNVCILGYGREGKAMEAALKTYAPTAKISIRDQKDGQDYLKDLDQFDVIIKSPGIPPQPEFVSVQTKITNSTQIFLDTINAPLPSPPPRGEGIPLVIGVTGSKGKSTTSSLIYHILKNANEAKEANAASEAHIDVSLIGNIGDPAIAHLDEANQSKIFVMELSSYQLMDLTVSPPIAVITSFFPEHLDYHLSLAAYKEAKKPIARFQKESDIIFFNAIYDEAKEIASLSPGKRVPFTAHDAPISIMDTHLIGAHNLSNIAAAWKVANYLDVTEKKATDAIRTFTPLPHRLQSLGIYGGIEWVNDSIATNPNATIAALDALGERITAIILGGQDRGFDYSALAHRITHSGIQHVVLLGETTPRLHDALLHAKISATISRVQTLKEAVDIAHSTSSHSERKIIPLILLSPAAPSYDMFKNFEERGKEFEKWIKKIPSP